MLPFPVGQTWMPIYRRRPNRLQTSVQITSDFDSLIADTEPLHCKAFRKVLDPLGVRFT
jgi:hypothetical protein